MTQIHVRGSSHKETLDLNELLQIFMVHGKYIYKWVSLKGNQQVTKICLTTSPLMPMSDNTFYFSEIQKDRESKTCTVQDIKMINILFSTHEV